MNTMIKTAAVTIITASAFLSVNANAGIEAKCKACHDFGTANKVGPGLTNLMGNKAGSTSFSKYSKSLKNADFIWDDANMRLWLGDGKKALKELTGDPDAKTTMPNMKLKGEKLDEMMEFMNGLQ
ncbi:MAG: cytochrome C [Gammaproteobacteria bacterium]|nr:cytochrome C [Gammaproteobacteria bacterium]MCF6362505.1 cytochrome C [Gammaproteobacteria bacterium]